MVGLINNLYGKDKMAVPAFDSISLTTVFEAAPIRAIPHGKVWGGGASLIHSECAALSREID